MKTVHTFIETTDDGKPVFKTIDKINAALPGMDMAKYKTLMDKRRAALDALTAAEMAVTLHVEAHVRKSGKLTKDQYLVGSFQFGVFRGSRAIGKREEVKAAAKANGQGASLGW